MRTTPPASNETDSVDPWIVRLFLILAFGVAFGIEGMTLIRSYFFTDAADAEAQVKYEEGERRDDKGHEGPRSASAMICYPPRT